MLRGFFVFGHMCRISEAIDDSVAGVPALLVGRCQTEPLTG